MDDGSFGNTSTAAPPKCPSVKAAAKELGGLDIVVNNAGITRDGLLIVAGLVLGTVWITLLLVFGYTMIEVVKDFILSLG